MFTFELRSYQLSFTKNQRQQNLNTVGVVRVMEEDKERNAFLRQLFRILKGDFSHQGIAFFLYPALKKQKHMKFIVANT